VLGLILIDVLARSADHAPPPAPIQASLNISRS
jgi:hypothetical protein